MPYTLGDVTLPRPKSLVRSFLEKSSENITMKGKTTKDTINRKENYVLTYQYLSLAQVGAILSEYNLNKVRSFTIDEDNLSVGPTDVFIDIGARDYPMSGRDYRENLKLILTEVK